MRHSMVTILSLESLPRFQLLRHGSQQLRADHNNHPCDMFNLTKPLAPLIKSSTGKFFRLFPTLRTFHDEYSFSMF